MISFNNRFHGHNSLNYAYRNGQAFRGRLMTLKIVSNPKRKKTRVAVVVSKKVLKSAVYRNRVRRQVYEYMQAILPKLNKIYDIVLIVTSGELLTTSHDEIYNQLDQLFAQANISKNNS